MNTKEELANFASIHGISGETEIVDNTSKIYLGDCYKTVLRYGNKQSTIYSYQNPMNPVRPTLESILWQALEESMDGCFETFERWYEESLGDYDVNFSKTAQRAMYAHHRQCYVRLTKLLGDELYQKLENIVY
jgi:hypothetical protein